MIDAKDLGLRRFDGPQGKILSGMSVTDNFKIGDHVSWNSEAGRVSGAIVRARTRDFEGNGCTRHASAETPQYEIKSGKTERIALHKGSALAKLRD